jgi:hypothetical protein
MPLVQDLQEQLLGNLFEPPRSRGCRFSGKAAAGTPDVARARQSGLSASVLGGKMGRVSTFPDPRSLARAELTSLIEELIGREQAVSEERRALHAQIDALRAELVARLRDEGTTVISGADVLGPPAGVGEPRDPRPATGSGAIALPEPPGLEHESDEPGNEPSTG